MGSEGAFGVVTAVTVRVRRVPVVKVYETWRCDSFVDGAAAMRTLAQAGVLPTVLRLSDETETQINLAKPAEVGGESAGGCLMVIGFEGTQDVGRRRRDRGRPRCSPGSAAPRLGEDAGWATGRFHGPYLRDSLLDVGVLVETVETVTFWSHLRQVYDAVKPALTATLGEGACSCSATSRTSTRPAPRSTSPSRPVRTSTRSRSGWRPRPLRPTR